MLKTSLPLSILKNSFFLCCYVTHAIANDEASQADVLATMVIDTPVQNNEVHFNSIWDRQDLQATEVTDLNQVLKNEAGVTINQGSGQMTSAVNLRGAGGTGQGMVTLDGVPLFGNFAGMFSLSHYPLDAFEQVTITRGSDLNQNGSRTLGGAIHLKTRHVQENSPFLHLEGGSFDTVRGAVGSGLNTTAGNFSAVVGRSDIFSGISQSQLGQEGDNFGLTHASGNWLKTLAHGQVDASLYFVRSDEEIDGPGLVLPRRIGWIDDKLGLLSNETWVSQLHGDYDVTPYWKSSLQFGFTQDRQKMVATRIKPFSISHQLVLVDWKNTHALFLDDKTHDKAELTWGVNTQHQQTLNVSASAQTTISPTVESEIHLGKWTWNAQGRFDHNDVYGDHPVYSFGVNHALSAHLNVFANGGTGYRQPGVSELLNPVFGNRTLKAESNAGGEVGVVWRPQPSSDIKVSGYHQNYHQMVVLMSSAIGTQRAENIPEVEIWGADMQARHRWSTRWESGFNYSYMDAINSLTRLQVASRPAHQGSIWNEIKLLPPLTLRIDLNVYGRYWFDAANKLSAHSAPRLNAMLKYQLTDKTAVYVRGENINDDRSPRILDFNYNGAAVYAGFRSDF